MVWCAGQCAGCYSLVEGVVVSKVGSVGYSRIGCSAMWCGMVKCGATWYMYVLCTSCAVL